MIDATRKLRQRIPVNYKEPDSHSNEEEAEFFESSNVVTDNNMSEELQRQIQALQEQLAALSSTSRHEDTGQIYKRCTFLNSTNGTHIYGLHKLNVLLHCAT